MDRIRSVAVREQCIRVMRDSPSFREVEHARPHEFRSIGADGRCQCQRHELDTIRSVLDHSVDRAGLKREQATL